jgi:hypothetical protein
MNRDNPQPSPKPEISGTDAVQRLNVSGPQCGLR